MDLWQLTIFCKIIEQRSFSRAGKLVHLSQPTVSSHVKDLEAHFGCRLIDRLAKEAVPTKEGELLYHYALRLTALRDEAEKALSQFKSVVEGHLVIGGSTIPGGHILPRIAAGFLLKFPQVYMALKVASTGRIIGDICSGELELGVVGARVSDRRLEQRVLVKDEMRLIVPADHRWRNRKVIPVKMLLQERLIVRESGSGTLRSIEESLQKSAARLKDFHVVAEFGTTEAIVQAVISKIGLSIVSRIAIIEHLRSGTLKALRIEGLDMERHFYLTHHKHRSLSPAGQAFADHLLRAAAEESLLGEVSS
ncbi:MAG: selenium metabolism-associated LysR family transcriptional regulator [Desulfobacterales bacterium]